MAVILTKAEASDRLPRFLFYCCLILQITTHTAAIYLLMLCLLAKEIGESTTTTTMQPLYYGYQPQTCPILSLQAADDNADRNTISRLDRDILHDQG